MAASAANPSAGLTVGSDGTVAVALSFVDPNGSAIRYAMDGNFTLLVDALPGNASSHASILAAIKSAESTIGIGQLFGDGAGSVSPAEVAMFENLLRYEAGTIPSAVLTGGGILQMSLDGNAPGSSRFDGVTFDGAVGADSSPAPITITSSSTLQFPTSGDSGTLGIAWNLTVSGGFAIPGPNVSVSVSTPAGTTITSSTGFQDGSVHNDALGYGAPTASGTLGISPTGTARVAFQPAFPLGDVLLGVSIAALVGAAAFLLWRRRRKAARGSTDAPRS